MYKFINSLISVAFIGILTTAGGCTVPVATGEASAAMGGLASTADRLGRVSKGDEADAKQERRIQQRPSLSCRAPRTQCGPQCVDTQTNAQHCGSCLHRCPTGASCAGGACACPSDRPAMCEGVNECLPRVGQGEPCQCQSQCTGASVFCQAGTCQFIG